MSDIVLAPAYFASVSGGKGGIMKILVACEESQELQKLWRNNGGVNL